MSESHERATEALGRIRGHEDLCEERYNGINNKLSDIKTAQNAMSARMWGAVTIIITLLLSILAYMLTKGVDHIMAETLRSAIMIATGNLT